MQKAYQLYRRANGIFYREDTATGKQVSLRTRDRKAALRLLEAENQTAEQPLLNRALAKTFLQAADPQLTRRIWQEVMDGYNRRRNRDSTRERCTRAFASSSFDAIRLLVVTETRPDHFLEVLTAGGNATNHYLRRLHNFALGMCEQLASLPSPSCNAKDKGSGGSDDINAGASPYLVVSCDLRKVNTEREELVGRCQLHFLRASCPFKAAAQVKDGLLPFDVALPGFSLAELEALPRECIRATA